MIDPYGNPDPHHRNLEIYPTGIMVIYVDETTGDVAVVPANLRDPRGAQYPIVVQAGLSSAPLPDPAGTVVMMTYQTAVATGLIPAGEVHQPF